MVERRSFGETDDFWYTPIAPVTESGIKVDEATALKYLTVFACVSLIAGDVARLPLILYRHLPGGGKERVTDHPLYDIIHTAPNPETTSFMYREAALGHNLLWGNHYAIISRNARNQIVGLWQLQNPGGVEVDRVNGNIVYKWRDEKNQEIITPRDEMFHVPGMSFNGLVGFSMITIAREAIGMGLAAETFGSRYFGEGTHPSGLLSLPAEVDLGENEEKYRDAIRSQYSGLGKSHTLMVLQNGEEYKPLTIPARDSQFLETRDHQKVEICGMYHVPPHKIALHGQNSNYNNLEQENSSYVDSCLMHWLVRWEQCISHQLLTEKERRSGLFVEFLVDGLLRGDSQARADFYMKMFQTGSMSPNDIREKENQNPIDGGDEYFVQLNMQTLKQAKENEKQAKQQQQVGQGVPVQLPEPEVEEKQLSVREQRSIKMRDRIAKNYHPLFVTAAQAVVNREALAVKKRISKERRADFRSDESLPEWIVNFYDTMPEFVKEKLGPVLRSYGSAIYDAAAAEAGLDANDPDIDKFIEDYIEGYAGRHVKSSRNQLIKLANEETIDDIDQRVDEWHEKRAEKIASNETTRTSNAIYQATAFSIGLTTVWRIRGASTCPYCQSLAGKRVASGQFFAMPGDHIKVDGEPDMKVRGLTAHPPIHMGCDCYLGMI